MNDLEMGIDMNEQEPNKTKEKKPFRFPDEVRAVLVTQIVKSLLTSSTNFNSAKDKESCQKLAERTLDVVEAVEVEWMKRRSQS